MRKGENVVKMGRAVRAVLDRFRTSLPSGLALEVLHDSPRQVDERVGSFMRNLLEGLAIVVLCMGLFMGLRAALISATAIPLSVLCALALMPLSAIDLELVSIAAFIVALGMLVDDNIIVVDNIDVKLREGLPPAEAAALGTGELTAPVIVGTLGNIFAFFPMLLLTRETGAYIRSLPLVLSFSLGASMLIAFTVAPLAARVLMRGPITRSGATRTTGRSAELYRRFLRSCLRHRALVVLASLASLAGAALLLLAVGFSFFPDAERDQLTVDLWLKEGTSIEETERIARQAEADLRRDAEVVSTLTYVGTGGPRFYITLMPELQTSNFAQIMVNTRSAEAAPGVVDRFNARARTRYPGARVFARKLVMGMPIEAPVALRLSGPELAMLRRLGGEVQDILRATRGTDQVRDNLGEDIPTLHVEVDAERASRIGVTHTDVALAFLSTHQGLELTRFTEEDKEIPIVLRLREEERRASGLAALPVASSITGEKVPLGSVAKVEPRFGPGVIRHHNGRRCLTVLAWTSGGRLANDVVKDAWPRLEALRLPPGYRLEIAGEKEEMDRAFFELLIVFAVILALLLGLLVIQLRKLSRVLVVLVAVPLSLVGAALGLYLGGYSFSFMAFLGVVSLAGMVIKNGVVWLEFVERARDAGRPREEAVVEAGIARLRPILLTAATTLGGLLPLGLFGGVLFEPMAWAMIAGLGLATVLTLIVVPVFYTLIVRSD
jgi:multidrug efflux pump subunit AcrB